MKRHFKLFMTALGLSAMLALSGCGQPVRETLDESAVLGAGHTENDVSQSEYTLMLENESLKFLINPHTTEFKTVNKADGAEWLSSNPNRQGGSVQAALFGLTYLNDKGNLAYMDAMTDSVADGKYEIEQGKDTVRVRYSVGNFSSLALVPYALTEERFRQVLDGLEDEFQQMKLEDFYYLTDINIIDDKDLRAQRLSEYPLLKEQPLYIARESVTGNASAKKQAAAIFTQAGYTKEDYEADSRYFRADETAEAEAGFNVTLEYALDGGSLCVRIPEDGLGMRGEFPLTSIALLPYFGSPQKGGEGYFLLPDGSGSVMNFYNGRGGGQIYKTAVYGDDPALADREKLADDPGAALPVFGIRSGKSGVLCEIEKGAAISQILAYPGDDTEDAYAHAAFDVRSTLKSTLSTGRKEPFFIIQKQRYTGELALRYHFLSGENASLFGMAGITSERLFGDREETGAAALPVRIEQVGMITRQNQRLGISYRENAPLTRFGQVPEIVKAFTDAGVSGLSVKLTGWFGGGVDHAFLSGKAKPAAPLGGQKGLAALLDTMKSKNIPLYLDADIQLTGKTGLFDGYRPASDATAMLNQSVGRIYNYDLSSFMRTANRPRYINNAAAQARAADHFADTLKAMDWPCLSLRRAGELLPADYGKNPADRQQMADHMRDRLKRMAESGFTVSAGGANAYALPYIRSAEGVPVTSSKYDNTDLSVPFLMMVLSGRVEYYAPPVNLSGDVQSSLLRAVAAGAGLACVLTAQNGDKTANSEHDYLYSTGFDGWKGTLPALFADCQKRLAGIAGRRMIGYEQLANGVTRTLYEGGRAVIVNHGDMPYRYDDITVGARDFAVKEVG